MKTKEMCKVTWCNRQDRFYKNGRKKTYCSVHVNRPGNASSRPWLYYKTERIAEGKLECEHCGDNYLKKHPDVDIKILSSLMDVDHIDPSIKGTIEGEQPSNYQLLCKTCHAIKSHKDGDYENKRYKNNNMGM